MTKAKIELAKIDLVHATGTIAASEGEGVVAGTAVEVGSYEEASGILTTWIYQNPPGSFNKVDYWILFENGREKSGTIKIGRSIDDRYVSVDFVEEVTRDLLRLISDDPADRAFREFVDKDGSKAELARKYLEEYDLGIAEPKPTTSPRP